MSISVPAGLLNTATRTLHLRGAGLYTTNAGQTPTMPVEGSPLLDLLRERTGGS